MFSLLVPKISSLNINDFNLRLSCKLHLLEKNVCTGNGEMLDVSGASFVKLCSYSKKIVRQFVDFQDISNCWIQRQDWDTMCDGLKG